MANPPNPTGTPDGAFEFETTDFSDARRALEEPPAGLDAARRAFTKSWESRRRGSQPSDHALLGSTVAWMLALAPYARPTKLVDMAPRIANAIAERWSDRTAAVAYLDELLTDRRGGRKGFPPPVRMELLLLKRLATTQRPPA